MGILVGLSRISSRRLLRCCLLGTVLGPPVVSEAVVVKGWQLCGPTAYGERMLAPKVHGSL